MFIAHGTQKLFNAPQSQQNAAVPLMSFMGLTGVLEFVGGLLILLGLFTRPTAFILSGMMAVAYFTAHAPGGFLPLVNKGELAVLYCFVFLFLAVAGGGAWSVDNLFGIFSLTANAPTAFINTSVECSNEGKSLTFPQ